MAEGALRAVQEQLEAEAELVAVVVAGLQDVLDTAGHRSLSRLRRALTPDGTLVIVGSEVRGRLLGGFDRNLRAVAWSRFVGQRLRMLSSTPRQDDLQALAELLAAGKVTPLVDRAYPLAETADAMRHLLAGNGRGKLVITV
jgi:NADPH:quinone reductase-like Zn-dependent oxidoreductase